MAVKRCPIVADPCSLSNENRKEINLAAPFRVSKNELELSIYNARCHEFGNDAKAHALVRERFAG
jgi:hypothetical protein